MIRSGFKVLTQDFAINQKMLHKPLRFLRDFTEISNCISSYSFTINILQSLGTNRLRIVLMMQRGYAI